MSSTGASGYVEGVYSEVVEELLTKHVPGWSKAKVFIGANIFFKKNWPGLSPVATKGDFNGDGKADYAALVETAGGREIYVFLKTSANYEVHFLGSGSHYIVLKLKGSKEFNWDLEMDIVLDYDAVEDVVFRKGATTWFFSDGEFRQFISGD